MVPEGAKRGALTPRQSGIIIVLLDLGKRLQLVPVFTNNSLTLTAVQGGSGGWNSDADGVVSGPGNWAGGMPSAAGDAATFGPAISAPRTITVDAPVTFGSLTFEGSNRYTLSGSNSVTLQMPGGSPQITVLAGSHTISAPVALAGNLAVNTAVGDSLELSGDVSDAGGVGAALTLSGNGELILSGVNTYSGGTNVDAGTLYVTKSIPNGTRLTVGGSGVFVFDPAQALASDTAVSGTAVSGGAMSSGAMSGGAATAVPEPGTLVLLVVVLCSAGVYYRGFGGPRGPVCRKALHNIPLADCKCEVPE